MMNKGKAAAVAGHAKPTDGADNNTRLAFLEGHIPSFHAAVFGLAGRYAPTLELAPKEGEDPLTTDLRLINEIAALPEADDLLTNISLLAVALATAGVTIPEGLHPILAAISFIEGSEKAAGDAILQGEIDRLAAHLLEHFPSDIEGSAVDTAIKLLDQAKASLSVLTVAMCGAGVNVPDGECPFPIAVAYFEQLEEVKATGGDATPGELAAIARAETAEKLLETADGEIATLKAFIQDKLAGGEPSEPPVPEVPRDAVEAGPTCGNLSAADIKAAIDDEATFELIFSDGTNEIVQISPTVIAHTDLVRHGNRYMVAPAVLVCGPRGQDAMSIELHGASLLWNGEQVGFCGFERPLTLEPGEQRQFHRAFLFG